jgi:hypothetical protein
MLTLQPKLLSYVKKLIALGFGWFATAVANEITTPKLPWKPGA